MSLKIAILASGSGTNAQVIFEAVRQKKLGAEICIVLSNRPDAKVLERAENFGLPHCAVDHTLFSSREEYDEKVVEIIKEHGADCVVLAGYMRMVTPFFLASFPERVINIHPAILPSFPGVHGARDAVRYGVKFSGCTVHFVSEEMDAGPIIIQAVTPCLQEDSEQTLQNRIHCLEHKVYVQALQWLAEDRLEIIGHTVHVKGIGKQQAKIVEVKSGDIGMNALIYPPLEIA